MSRDTTQAESRLEVRGLHKYFGDFAALRGVNFSITTGESVLLYGANGAGKTTLLRVLALLTEPSQGGIFLNGKKTDRRTAALKSKIGFASHATFLYGDLTVQENLSLTGKLFGLQALNLKVASALETFGLADRRYQAVRSLSRGLQQRVTLARALLHDPDFLLLDEPFTGLDAGSAAGLESLLRRLSGEGKGIAFSTHDFAQGASIARRLVVLESGCVRYDGAASSAPAEMRAPGEPQMELSRL
ncbi:MAG: ABC transporter ATP-binding protein [Terriglobia bacterium]